MTLQQQSQLIQTFLYSLKSKETQKMYLIYLKYFEEWGNRKIEDLLTLHSKSIEEILIQYIVYIRNKGLSYSTIKCRLAAILSFLEINDITVNHKKLRRFTGEHTRTIKDEAYSRSDLLKMFEQATFRTRVVISIYSSTGMRKTALLKLQLKHLHKLETLYQFTIYENTKDEYITFCTPECANLIDTYIEQRKQAGEKITDESYLIRNDFDNSRKYRVRQPKPITERGLNGVIDKLLHDIQLRETNHRTENYKYQRHKKASFHGFRKFFNTCLVNSDVNVTIKEILMGHSVGLDDSYFRPNERQLLLEYSKAINELTINEENRLKVQIKKLEVDKSVIDQMREQIMQLQQKMESNQKAS